MGAKILGIATMVVLGIMLADGLTHPAGVTALGTATNNILETTGNQLIGVASKSTVNTAPVGGGT